MVSVVYQYLIHVYVSAFNEAPASQEAAIGSEAIFRCQHPAAFSLGWRVNGTFYIQGSIPDITLGFNTEDGNLVSTLTIVATVDYNGTRVACVASLTNGSTEISAPVLLIVQGENIIHVCNIKTAVVHVCMMSVGSLKLR